MKNTIIVHGKPSKEIYYSDKYPSSSNFAWIPWLQKQLIINDIKADTPEMPFAYEPQYELWRTEFERFDITPQTILVGHSAGASFLIRWLSENKDAIIEKVILIAPSIDPARKSKTGFCDFEIDSQLTKRAKKVVIFKSDGDSSGTNESIEILQTTLSNIKIIELVGFGHFIPDDMGTNEFPALLEEILK